MFTIEAAYSVRFMFSVSCLMGYAIVIHVALGGLDVVIRVERNEVV